MYELFYVIFFLVIIGAAWYFVIRPMGIKLPRLPKFGRKSAKIGLCPFCGGEDIYYSAKRGIYYCGKCNDGGMGFIKPVKPISLPQVTPKTIGATDLEELLYHVPDEFKLNATAFLKGNNPDKVWLELFSYKYPKWYRNFINLYIGVTKK